MTKEKLTPRYWTNKSIKIKIDKLLEQNASNVANSGTNNKRDIGDDDKVNEAWETIQDQIKKLDHKFYEIIKQR